MQRKGEVVGPTSTRAQGYRGRSSLRLAHAAWTQRPTSALFSLAHLEEGAGLGWAGLKKKTVRARDAGAGESDVYVADGD